MTIYPYQQVQLEWGGLAHKWAAARANLSASEVLSTIVEESSGNAKAINKSDPSWGLMGVSFYIGQKFAQIKDYSQLYDPDTNIEAGSGFLSYLKTHYAEKYPLGSGEAYIQIYNLGEPVFMRGVRVPGYEQAYMLHLAAFDKLLNVVASQP